MRGVGAHQGLAPVADVARDPRWGRIEETIGEDPYLVGSMVTAYVRGLQGDDPETGIIATLKHFAGYSFSEAGRNFAPSHVGRREMGDVFLLPFEMAVKAGAAGSVMNSYQEVDGEQPAASHWLLTETLPRHVGLRRLRGRRLRRGHVPAPVRGGRRGRTSGGGDGLACRARRRAAVAGGVPSRGADGPRTRAVVDRGRRSRRDSGAASQVPAGPVRASVRRCGRHRHGDTRGAGTGDRGGRTFGHTADE